MSKPEIEPPAPAILNRRPPVDVALDILTEKYPGALFAFVAGSFNVTRSEFHPQLILRILRSPLPPKHVPANGQRAR